MNYNSEVGTLRKRTPFHHKVAQSIPSYFSALLRLFLGFGLARTIGGLISAFQSFFQQTKYCLPSSFSWTWNRLASQFGHLMFTRILRLLRPSLGRHSGGFFLSNYNLLFIIHNLLFSIHNSLFRMRGWLAAAPACGRRGRLAPSP